MHSQRNAYFFFPTALAATHNVIIIVPLCMSHRHYRMSEECVCEPPRACLCCHRSSETVEWDLLYAYQGLRETTKDAEPVEDHLPASIHPGASNLPSDEDLEDRIKLSDHRVQKLTRTYLGVFDELPPPASCDKLIQMDLKLKLKFMGHKIRRGPYLAPVEQADEFERQIQECINAGLVLGYKDGDYPNTAAPVSWWLNLGPQPNGWWWNMES